MNTIEIWAPKYSTREVLVAPYKIEPGMNRVVFTKDSRPNLLMDGEKMKSYPMISNGKIGVHAIPLKDFQVEERNLQLL